jgi:hypothetical protein
MACEGGGELPFAALMLLHRPFRDPTCASPCACTRGNGAVMPATSSEGGGRRPGRGASGDGEIRVFRVRVVVDAALVRGIEAAWGRDGDGGSFAFVGRGSFVVIGHGCGAGVGRVGRRMWG